jgi:hypothetical protein
MAKPVPAFAYVFAVGLGLMAGLVLAFMTMKQGMAAVGHGWSASRVTGSVDADALTRARAAMTGLMALKPSQAIAFVRDRDDAGRVLDEHCRYRISGGPLPGRWWSVTVYGEDAYLPRNHDRAPSIDATRVQPDRAGNWQGFAAPAPLSGPTSNATWVSTRNAGHFELTLRIYAPTPGAQADFARIALPHVDRIACDRVKGA